MVTRIFVTIVAAGILIAFFAYAAEESGAQQSVTLESETDKISYAIGGQVGQSFKAGGSEFDLNEFRRGVEDALTDPEKESYATGAQVGQTLKAQGIEVNLDTFMRGVEDMLLDREPVLSPDELRQVMDDFRMRVMAERQEQRKKETEENLAEGKAFLEENKKKPGVKVLPSGLQYKVLQEGTGRIPTESDRIRTHYRGTFIDGTEFDSSYKEDKPVEFAVNRVIAGWTEALQLMKEGAKWQLFIPPDLAYGERGRPPRMPPNAVLIFELELLEIMEGLPEVGTENAPR